MTMRTLPSVLPSHGSHGIRTGRTVAAMRMAQVVDSNGPPRIRTENQRVKSPRIIQYVIVGGLPEGFRPDAVQHDGSGWPWHL
jgi:hypothetical protein